MFTANAVHAGTAEGGHAATANRLPGARVCAFAAGGARRPCTLARRVRTEILVGYDGDRTLVINAVQWLWYKRDSWVVVVLLAISLGINVFLGQELWHQASRVAQRESLMAGARLANLTVEDPAGRRVTINWAADKRPVVMYFFSPSCGWCARNLRNIKALSEARRADYRFVGISLFGGNIERYVRDNNLMFPVYTNPQQQDAGRLIIDSTPLTAIISADGTVADVWRGAYTGSLRANIEKRMGVRLPGLDPVAPSSPSSP